jgi:hypothetical protein
MWLDLVIMNKNKKNNETLSHFILDKFCQIFWNEVRNRSDLWECRSELSQIFVFASQN